MKVVCKFCLHKLKVKKLTGIDEYGYFCSGCNCLIGMGNSILVNDAAAVPEKKEVNEK